MMSTMMKVSQRANKSGFSIAGFGHSFTKRQGEKLRKTNIQVKVALIGAISVVVAAIITAVLGPALINRIAIPTPTPVYIVGPSHGTINSMRPNIDKNTSNSRTDVQGNDNNINVHGRGNKTSVQGNDNNTNVQGNNNNINVQGSGNSINSGP